MLGHLKAHDFVNLMEGAVPFAKHQAHIEACRSCRATWQAMESLKAEVESMDNDVPEPDWAQFRASVRDQLLSRSIQRQSVVRRWTGWAIRPALAWALSLLLAVGIPTGAFLWHLQKDKTTSSRAWSSQTLPAADLIEAGTEKTVFEDVVGLSDTEQAQFQQMLEAAQTDAPRLQ